MFRYHKYVVKRAWSETRKFMGWWPLNKPSLLKSILLWVLASSAYYFFGGNYLPERMAELVAAIAAAGCLVIISFIWHLIRAPSVLYWEQDKKIAELDEAAKTKEEKNRIAGALKVAYDEGLVIRANLNNLTLNNQATLNSRDFWIARTHLEMKNYGISENELFYFLNPHIPTGRTSADFESSLVVLHNVIGHLKSYP